MAAAAVAELPPDYNQGPNILIACGISVGIALVLVLLRIYVRVWWTKNFGADDYCMVAAMTVIFVEMMMIIPEVQLGAGRHVQYIEPKTNVARGLHLNFVTQPICLIALCLTKLSVGLFLLRLTPSPRHARFIWGVMVFTVASSTGNLLTVFFQCRPLQLVWDASIDGNCLPASHLKFAAYFNSSVSCLTDLLFALLPGPFLWRVQMSTRTKVVVIGILSLGVFAMVSGIVKIAYLGSYGKHGDFLYNSTPITIWTTVEICTAIAAASAPCLKPLFGRFFQSEFFTSAHKYADAGRGYKTYEGRATTDKVGVELEYRAQVSAGGPYATIHHNNGMNRTESEEEIMQPEDRVHMSKSFSVSVA